MLTLSQFITKYNGRSAYYNGGDQCVALVELWAINLGKHPIHIYDAKQIFAAASSTEWLKIPNRAANYPPAGAIIVCGSAVGHGHGHTMIARPGCSPTTLLSFDQNWSTPYHCHLENHTGSSGHPYGAMNVIGWLVRR